MDEDAGGLPVIGLRLMEGRTGSTLLMQLLGTSQAVVFDRRYPAEYRFLSYFARVAEQMTEPFDPERHLSVTPFFFGPRPSWGPVPFTSDVVAIGSLAGPLVHDMWRAWSRQALARNPKARYYAEKLAVPVDTIRRAGLDVRVVDVVRDPRDVLASIRAFTARGIDGFGRQPGQAEVDYVTAFIQRVEVVLHQMHASPSDLARLVVRYEDLATDLHGCATRIGRWLGIELDADAVLRDRAQFVHHMTTSSVDASIGRWRTDLFPADAQRITDSLGPLLAPFGYVL